MPLSATIITHHAGSLLGACLKSASFAEGRRAGARHLVLAPVARFIKFYSFRLGFLDGVPGLVHVCIGGMNSFNRYAKLIALQRTAAYRETLPKPA